MTLNYLLEQIIANALRVGSILAVLGRLTYIGVKKALKDAVSTHPKWLIRKNGHC